MNNNLLDNISISIEEIFSHIKMALIFVIFLGTIYAIIFTLMGEMKRIPVLGSFIMFYPIIYAIFAFILGFIVMHLGILKLVLPIATLIIAHLVAQELEIKNYNFQMLFTHSISFFIPLFFDVFFRRWRIYKNYVMFPKLTIFLNILYYLYWGIGVFAVIMSYIEKGIPLSNLLERW
ncbi:hypothetical protein F7P74_08505 [Helicobacter pullorum NCTC 12824]|nr:hypothetical protein F7P74_08505 [Helicobacter pullorum NCTC 12824]